MRKWTLLGSIIVLSTLASVGRADTLVRCDSSIGFKTFGTEKFDDIQHFDGYIRYRLSKNAPPTVVDADDDLLGTVKFQRAFKWQYHGDLFHGTSLMPVNDQADVFFSQTISNKQLVIQMFVQAPENPNLDGKIGGFIMDCVVE